MNQFKEILILIGKDKTVTPESLEANSFEELLKSNKLELIKVDKLKMEELKKLRELKSKAVSDGQYENAARIPDTERQWWDNITGLALGDYERIEDVHEDSWVNLFLVKR